MRSWIPVPGTAKERLVRAALEQFGRDRYDDVAVGAVAAAAGVTTGSLYHHFGSKQGLHAIVRAEVEQRVVDRMRGAAAVAPIDGVGDLAPVLLVGFDYLVGAEFGRLLSEDPDPLPDPVADLLAELVDEADVPISVPLAAAWRACLRLAATDPAPARAALARLVAAG